MHELRWSVRERKRRGGGEENWKFLEELPRDFHCIWKDNQKATCYIFPQKVQNFPKESLFKNVVEFFNFGNKIWGEDGFPSSSYRPLRPKRNEKAIEIYHLQSISRWEYCPFFQFPKQPTSHIHTYTQTWAEFQIGNSKRRSFFLFRYVGKLQGDPCNVSISVGWGCQRHHTATSEILTFLGILCVHTAHSATFRKGGNFGFLEKAAFFIFYKGKRDHPSMHAFGEGGKWITINFKEEGFLAQYFPREKSKKNHLLTLPLFPLCCDGENKPENKA